WQQVDFIGKRRYWFTLSAVGVAVAIVALSVSGLNLGIDFRGGSQVTFTTAQPIAVDDIRASVSDVVSGSPVVQGRGEDVDGTYTSFQVKTEALSGTETDALQGAIQSEIGAQGVVVRNVSGSFSSQILRNAIVAVVVSVLLIALYITIRFQWRFALPVLIALTHDLLIALGVYALVGREVSTATVAAILTILGFSIYDTIIIFDRVRENMPIMKRSSIAAIANQSLWETIRRSISTTIVVLIPILFLLIFGGTTLKDFAFALIVGIASGAYSTIFVASPLLTLIMEREPEYAKRKGPTLPTERVRDSGPEEPEPLIPEPVPAPAPLAAAGASGGEVVAQQAPAKDSSAAAKREARRQRRRSRPHGRAR
ncbi:MAG: protein translocase subunit SecF, partial [Gaiellales bacterium]